MQQQKDYIGAYCDDYGKNMRQWGIADLKYPVWVGEWSLDSGFTRHPVAIILGKFVLTLTLRTGSNEDGSRVTDVCAVDFAAIS